MDKKIQAAYDDLSSTDDPTRLDALQTILKLTDEPVDWAYEVWEDLVERLDHENSYQRSIAIMVLCNLAKSDSKHRMAFALVRLLAHTRDDKFITSRQCIQNIWKIAAVDPENRDKVVHHLEKRFSECASEKHYNLLRQDIIQSMKDLGDHLQNEAMIARAQKWLVVEKEENYRKKYEAILQGKG